VCERRETERPLQRGYHRRQRKRGVALNRLPVKNSVFVPARGKKVKDIQKERIRVLWQAEIWARTASCVKQKGEAPLLEMGKEK